VRGVCQQNASTGNYVQYLNLRSDNINERIQFNVSILGKGELKINGYLMDPPYVYENYSFNRITFFITNTGTSPLENLNITVLSNGLKIINKPMILSVLPPYIPFNYTILYNSPSIPGNYYINLMIGNVSYNVNINVLKDPQIIVTKDFPQITPGASKLQLTFYIKNNGPEKIKMMQIHFIYPQILSLHVSSSNPLEGLYLNNVTLVNINVNENYSVPYVVDVADNAQPGVYTGQLIFSIFTDNSTEPIIESYTFTFQVSTPFFSTGNVQSILSLPDITIFILLIIIAILAVMYIRLLRKIRKQ